MQSPDQLDPEKTATLIGAIVAALTFIWAGVSFPFKTFLTKKAADAMFIKKVEADGTRTYVHVSEWEPMLKKMEDNLEESQKWRAMAKDWMEHP